jgi:hypothetical protein
MRKSAHCCVVRNSLLYWTSPTAVIGPGLLPVATLPPGTAVRAPVLPIAKVITDLLVSTTWTNLPLKSVVIAKAFAPTGSGEPMTVNAPVV